MSSLQVQALVVVDPDLHHGEPCIRGTRIPVSILVGSLADLTMEELLAEYDEPGTHGGILVLRPDRVSIADYRALLEYVLERHPLESLRGAVAVATPRRVRVRRR